MKQAQRFFGACVIVLTAFVVLGIVLAVPMIRSYGGISVTGISPALGLLGVTWFMALWADLVSIMLFIIAWVGETLPPSAAEVGHPHTPPTTQPTHPIQPLPRAA